MPLSSSSNSVQSPRCAAQATFPLDASGTANSDQQVDALWARIAQATVRTPEIDNNVEVNSSFYPCVKNSFQISVKKHDETKPIHGHRWTTTHSDPSVAGRITEHVYSAAQSPEKDWPDQLIDALDAGRGIFEFVSPRAMQGGQASLGYRLCKWSIN